ncbi:unnamed protein product [Closterium sp. NIES-64]|nr:unnamed protein product [Closterium sp. NIES-64]
MDLVRRGVLVVVQQPVEDDEAGAGTDTSSSRRLPREIFILGTTHVSETAGEDAMRVVRSVQPQNVVVELCKSRAPIMYDPVPDPNQLSVPSSDATGAAAAPARDLFLMGGASLPQTLMRSIQLGGQSSLLLRLLLSFVSRRSAQAVGVQPGHEFRAAREAADAIGAQMVLGDRPIEITLRRAWKALSLLDRARLASALLQGGLKGGSLEQSELKGAFSRQRDSTNGQGMEGLNMDRDVVGSGGVVEKDDAEGEEEVEFLSAVFQEVARQFPTLIGPLVHERDAVSWHSKLASHYCLSHITASLTLLPLSHYCLSHITASLTLLPLSHYCLSHITASLTLLPLSHYCLSHITASLTLLPLSHYCLSHITASLTLLPLSHYCLSHITASLTLLPLSHYCLSHITASLTLLPLSHYITASLHYCLSHITASLTLLPLSHYCLSHITASLTLLPLSHYCLSHITASLTLLPVSHYCLSHITASTAASPAPTTAGAGVDTASWKLIESAFGFSFLYPSSYIVTINRKNDPADAPLTADGAQALAVVGNFVTFDTMSVIRYAFTPNPDKLAPLIQRILPNGNLSTSLVEDTVFPNQPIIELPLDLQKILSALASPAGLSFDVITETCRGRIEEGKGGVGECVSVRGADLVQPIVRRHIGRILLSEGYLYVITASCTEARWPIMNSQLLAALQSFAFL